MNSREKREKLEKLAKLKDIHAEVLFYRCLDISVDHIPEKLESLHVREYARSTVWSRFTTIFRLLHIEGDEKEAQLVQEYGPIFLEFVKSEEDLKNWGYIRKKMLDQAHELQPKGERSLRSLLGVFLAIFILLLAVSVISRLHTVVAGCAELSSMILSDKPRNDPFKRHVDGWIPFDDGDGYTMLQAKTSDNDLERRIGPELLDGCIDYRFKIESYDKDKHKPTDEISDYGKVEFNFRLLEKSPQNPGEQSYLLDFLPNLDRAGLTYRNDITGEWTDLAKGRSNPLGIDTGKWYYVTLDIQGDTIMVYLQEEGQEVSKEDLRRNPIISSQDSRISKEGIFSFYVGPYATVYIDNVKIWDAR